MLWTCPHCALELEHTVQDPMTAIHHFTACDQVASSSASVHAPKNSSTNFEQSSPKRDGPETRPTGAVQEVAYSCPVCNKDVISLPLNERVAHFNSCWSDGAAVAVNKDPATSASKTVCCMLPPPTPGLAKCIPAPVANVSMPESSCLTCARDLSACSDCDALHHRAFCFSRQLDKSCPVCKRELSDSRESLPSSLLHMQRCQRGGQDGYSFIEADDFEALYKSLVGRFEIMERFAKRFHGDSRRSRAAYKQKIQKKRDHTEFVYECGESALRNSVNEDGEELDSWRTPGNVGKAARNLFPVVNEDFDPYIIMEGPQTQLFTAPTPLTSNSGSTSTTSNDIAVQSFAPAQYKPEILPTDATPRAILFAEALSGPLSQADTKTPIIDAITMPASDLTQVQKCIFCTTDPQGTHKRFDKIEKAGKIKCNKSGHDIFTCGRCTSNYHPVAEMTPQLQAHALPRIILTSPNSKHSSVLESFAPNKTALYPPAKKRGRANWMAYKWMPKVRELVDEKTMQFTKARNRSLRRESQRYGAVQHLATSALASTPITFFGPGSKPTAELDLVAQAMASTYASPIATASTGPSIPPKDTFSPSILPKSKHHLAQDLNNFRSNRSYSEVAPHGEGTHNLRDNNPKPRKPQPRRLYTVNNFQNVASQELQDYLSEKASHIIGQKSDCTDTLRADDSDAKKTRPKLPITFSSCTSGPEMIITFGARARPDGSTPSGKISIIHLANGSPSHRPFFSPSVYTLIFTTASEICEDEEPGSPTSPPPSPTWSTASTASSCVSEIETHAGWETLAKEYDDAVGGLC